MKQFLFSGLTAEMLKTIILCEGNKYLVEKSFVGNCMNFTCCHLIKEWLNVLHARSKIVKASKLQMDFLLYVFFLFHN